MATCSVNGHRVNVASYQCKPGDSITVRKAPRSQQLIGRFLEITQGNPVPELDDGGSRQPERHGQSCAGA